MAVRNPLGRRSGPLRPRFAYLLTLLVAAGGAACPAGEAATDEHIAARLAAGEFGPALRAAEQLPASQRDRALTRIADAQWSAGSRGAALSTAGQMTDDSARTGLLRSLRGARGGGAEADFDSLIDLIVNTVQPDSWDENGGKGTISPFATGVIVDTEGLLKRAERVDRSGKLLGLRDAAAASNADLAQRDPRRAAPLRKVSLARLDRQLQLLWAAGRTADATMTALAGLERVKYVLVYPESRDVVLAGPAGDWQADAEGRVVGSQTGRPVLQLDDLVVLLRHFRRQPGGEFGCAITPTTEGLARTKEYLASTSAKPIKPGQRNAWLAKLRERLGRQTIEVNGIDPRTRVARVIVEADYRMKLVGMGLEKGPPGVRSYLDTIEIPPGGSPPPLDVLRWWFVMNYDAVRSTDDGLAFEWQGQGVKVLSENEMLTERGERVHTGQSNALNATFAEDFTRHFDALAQIYPVYADLQNIFDLALAAAVVTSRDLPARSGWTPTSLVEPEFYSVALEEAPEQVDSVINHRVFPGKHIEHIVAGVSGGVVADVSRYVDDRFIKVDTYGKLRAQRAGSGPQELPPDAWWWD